MKSPRSFILIPLFVLALLVASTALAQEVTPSPEDVIRGGQLYDKWYAVLGVEPPTGNMPIWERQTTNTRSGADTWRCSECHGWDYRGAQGEYQSGSHFTGFPNLLMLIPDLQVEDIVNHLHGKIDPAHDFSPYLDDTSINQLAYFLKFGTIDDTQFIDPVSLQIIEGDAAHGKELFQATCQTCHGEDGRKIQVQIEGFSEYLGNVANRDPWRFLHRTRFGVAGVNMPVGLGLGWQPEDGRDVLAFAQSLPTGGVIISQPTQNLAVTPMPQVGGPATNLWTGILTSLGAMLGMGIASFAFIGGFILMALIVVIILRNRGKRKL